MTFKILYGAKIKIKNDTALRLKIVSLYKQTNKEDLSGWSGKCAEHVLNLIDMENVDKSIIETGFKVIDLCRKNEISVHEIRKAGFNIHKTARSFESEIIKNAIRSLGHAVGTGHMKEHAMVCSDYAVKTVQLLFPNQKEKITEERKWQLNELKKFHSQHDNYI